MFNGESGPPGIFAGCFGRPVRPPSSQQTVRTGYIRAIHTAPPASLFAPLQWGVVAKVQCDGVPLSCFPTLASSLARGESNGRDLPSGYRAISRDDLAMYTSLTDAPLQSIALLYKPVYCTGFVSVDRLPRMFGVGPHVDLDRCRRPVTDLVSAFGTAPGRRTDPSGRIRYPFSGPEPGT